MSSGSDPFGARATLSGVHPPTSYYRLAALAEQGLADLPRLPFTVRVLLENVLPAQRRGRRCPGDTRSCARAGGLAAGRVGAWRRGAVPARPRPPAGLHRRPPCGGPGGDARRPSARLGGDPAGVNPLVPADLVIDHSVQVDCLRHDRWRSRRTSSASTSATASATRCCAGRSRRSRLPASCRRARASSIRSTWSTWRRSSSATGRDGRWWRSPIRWSAPTRTRR